MVDVLNKIIAHVGIIILEMSVKIQCLVMEYRSLATREYVQEMVDVLDKIIAHVVRIIMEMSAHI